MNSIKQSNRGRLFIYSAALVSALSLSAAAHSVAAQDAFMPVGKPILAPTAFLEMCSRSPVDCQHSAQVDLVRTQTLARQSLLEKYDLIFGGARKNSTAQQVAAAETAEVATAQISSQMLYISWPMPSEDRMPVRLRPVNVPASFILPADTDRDPTPGALNDSAWGNRRLSWANRADTDLTPPVMVAALSPVEPAVIEAVASDDDTPMLYMTEAEMAAVKARRAERAAAKAASITVRVKSAYAAALSYQAPTPIARRQIFATTAPETTIAQSSGQNQSMSDYVRIDLDRDTLLTVKRANAYVNRVLISQTDLSKRHVNDYWEAPSLEGRPTGDCEDFALAKRRC
jgi:predicted transglutaminase-like cysteine proteinase